MDPNDREQLIDVSFRFVSWLRKNFPDVKDTVCHHWAFDGFGKRIRETPTAFWGDVGAKDYEILTRRSENGEHLRPRGDHREAITPGGSKRDSRRLCRGAHVSTTRLARRGTG